MSGGVNLPSDENKFAYQSKERDIESGYDYFEARLYDSATGRFLQIDPLSDFTSLFQNSYAGMNLNPILVSDPTGLMGDTVVYYTDGTIDHVKQEEEVVTPSTGGTITTYSPGSWIPDLHANAILRGMRLSDLGDVCILNDNINGMQINSEIPTGSLDDTQLGNAINLLGIANAGMEYLPYNDHWLGTNGKLYTTNSTFHLCPPVKLS